MATYFVFSDESGDFGKDRSDAFIRSQPFYCRAALILNADDWVMVRESVIQLKSELLSIEPNQEIKWSYIWSIYKYQKNRQVIPESKPYYYLRNHSLDNLLLYVDKSLELLQKCDDCYLILTMTFNDTDRTGRIDEGKLLMMHLQDMMQRIEMHAQVGGSNLCLVFFDTKGKVLDDKLKNAYQDFFEQDSFIEKYRHIVDSLLIDYSHQSIGIQIADFCAGVFNGSLRGYNRSTNIFKSRISEKVRRHNGKIFGYGICEIPKSQLNRAYLKQKLKGLF